MESHIAIPRESHIAIPNEKIVKAIVADFYPESEVFFNYEELKISRAIRVLIKTKEVFDDQLFYRLELALQKAFPNHFFSIRVAHQ